jgi:hypothetical protein
LSAQLQELWQLHPMRDAHLAQVIAIENAAYEFPWTEGVFRDCLRVGYSAWIVVDRDDSVLAYALMSAHSQSVRGAVAATAWARAISAAPPDDDCACSGGEPGPA